MRDSDNRDPAPAAWQRLQTSREGCWLKWNWLLWSRAPLWSNAPARGRRVRRRPRWPHARLHFNRLIFFPRFSIIIIRATPKLRVLQISRDVQPLLQPAAVHQIALATTSPVCFSPTARSLAVRCKWPGQQSDSIWGHSPQWRVPSGAATASGRPRPAAAAESSPAEGSRRGARARSVYSYHRNRFLGGICGHCSDCLAGI